MVRRLRHLLHTHRRVGLLFVEQGVVSGCGFVTTLLLVRALGLEAYGIFGLILAMTLFVLGLQLALVSQPMMAVGPKRTVEERPEFFGSMLVLQGAFTLLATAGVALAYASVQRSFPDAGLEGTLVPATLTIVGRQVHAFFRSTFFVVGRSVRALLLGLATYAVQLGLLVALAVGDRLTLASCLWAMAASSLTAGVLGLLLQGRVQVRLSSALAAARRCWRSGRWLAVMFVFQWSSANAFLVASAASLGPAAAGSLKAAHNVIGVLGVILLALENFVPVDAARRLARSGLPGMTDYLRRTLVWGLTGTGALAAAVALRPDALLQLLYAEHADAWAAEALRAFALIYVLSFGITLLNVAFRSMERTGLLAACHILTALPVIAGAHALVERFGFQGAVAGMVAHKALVLACLAGSFVSVSARLRRARAAVEPS